MAAKDKNPNPHNSSLVQALLEARKCVPKMNSGALKHIDALLSLAQNNIQFCTKTDSLIALKQYNQNNITFCRTPLINETDCFNNLKPTTYAVFSLMCRSLRSSYYLKASTRKIAKAVNLSVNTVTKALQYLVNNGYIAVLQDSVGNKDTIYMINPRAVGIGKMNQYPRCLQEFKGVADKKAWKRFDELYESRKWQMAEKIIHVTDYNGVDKKIKVSEILPFTGSKKENCSQAEKRAALKINNQTNFKLTQKQNSGNPNHFEGDYQCDGQMTFDDLEI